ncbi:MULTISPECIES: hypothetical protein [Enterobacteriaceae]|uniref:hypothetical protein n=1 Tax=Enterobacteriaceae TaxID=543 RepID=UPI002E2D114A|nr:hypothetical protein [Klebsiella pneumoniae]MED6004926.1 hypothetical protein [Klebsiella pneumoniae]MED6058260.1 hypothetical protein [Klebsiella pneumoniae]
MNIKIKTFNGELPNYLTLDKEYEVISLLSRGAIFLDDDGNERMTLFKRSEHLNGGEWELIRRYSLS